MVQPAERVVLITGASGGLGAAVTRAFLDDSARVAAVQRASADAEVFTVAAELTTSEGAAHAIAAARERFGRLDALVHLVGGFEGGTAVEQTDDGVWNRMFGVNVNSAFYAIRAALPAILESGRGRILAIGSRTALEPAATLAAYSASKAALVSLIRTVAIEVRGRGATANIVLPSVIDTPANRAAAPAADASKWVRPEAIARLLVWLASDAAADVNGAVIPIYGQA